MPTNLVYEDAGDAVPPGDEVDVTEAVLEMLERDNGASGYVKGWWEGAPVC